MVNEFREGGNDLVPVDYSNLLQQILAALRHQNPFKVSSDRRRLAIDIDEIATNLAKSQTVQNPIVSANGVRAATVNFASGFRDRFPKQIHDIRSALRQQLQTAIGSEETIERFVDGLIVDLEAYQGRSQQLGFTFDFSRQSQSLHKQKLSLESKRPGGESLLKFHKLTIAVRNVNRFQSDLRQAIENYINTEIAPDSEEDAEQIFYMLNNTVIDEFSDFHQLQKIVDTESLGKLKKEAKIVYLEHLLANIETTDKIAVIYLQDLIRRLRAIERYINDIDKTDSDYEVNYAGVKINYKDVFSRAEVLDALPIIPIIDSNLGEHNDRDRGECKFIFGLKLKLGGAVQTHNGKKVFDYNLDLINPKSQEHRNAIADESQRETFARKVLTRVLLYYFAFASPCNPDDKDYNPDAELEYDPTVGFETKVMPVLRGNDENAKRKIFKGIINGMEQYNVRKKIKQLRELLKNFLSRQTILPTRIYSRHISVRKGILKTDIESLLNGYFFDEVLERNPKESLRYLTIGEAKVDPDAVCQLSASIKIEDMRYFPEPEREEFSWKYQIDGIQTLAIAWTPKSNPCWDIYKRNFQKYKLILFPYDNTPLNPGGLNATQTFVYRFAWTVLAYIFLDILLEKAPKKLFVPMLRLHQGTHENPFPAEKFLANLSKGITHLFGDKYRVNSQGFRVNQFGSFKIVNALNSLYSVLPKTFEFRVNPLPPQLDKLAIVVVSSRESDASTNRVNRDRRIANIMGEVVSITRLSDGKIAIERLTTFSDNCSLRRLYRQPPILIDTINQLYRQGYRHILYVAQAPYTSTLHITRSDTEDPLYFMSSPLIKALLENNPEINIYPVFFDKYYVRKLREPRVNSLVVQNTQQLTNISQDPSQQAVVFFNLFNGITVGKSSDRFYNGVISYSTLLGNFYPDVMDDRAIREALIYDTPLKNDILQYLSLFHFSRFDRETKQSLKLDPYEMLIGEESLGALSIFEGMIPRVDFNCLAFLTEVKKVLDLREKTE